MNWPAATDYRDVLQYPERFLKIDRVRKGPGKPEVERNHLKVPKPRTGTSAHVYQLTCGPTPFALRVFLYPSDQREHRYEEVHRHLKTARAACPALIDSHYHRQGISVNGGDFP